MELQRVTTAGLREALPELARIARGEARTVYDRTKGCERTVVVYPRDQIGAAAALLAIARDGVRPEHDAWEAASAMEKPERDGPMIPLLPVGADFSLLQAETPDGRTFTAKVERTEVIGGEVDDRAQEGAGTSAADCE
jgi:hypothetical protein